ncbi:T9SS type A sorting domain-containing protein [Chitinophaga sp. SYP-B3965]|uniref:T9SS type A sorting domain-containing protein n=1 Tax=Chitinophaga sp. SYP-B3965 TaxID=2663120 RepID=UPI001299C66B|nr:T9SS type A sorting domain-containing protein [Chitinophaga sp. SYP-B3965]MRG44677.1 T9SS type A sorting domain-containing protein [Chitinophaga sp. SYP-B3965]
MKKIYWFYIFLLPTITFAQTQSNVTTPKGSSVVAYIYAEGSSTARGNTDIAVAAQYPNAVQTSYFNDGYSSSARFNCHGYAWNMVEGGPVRWIGVGTTTHEDIYMTDGSYVQVCSETYPGKVSLGVADHSAITTSTPGIWQSKWGGQPLMTHASNDHPYYKFDYTYWVSTAISGPAEVCSPSTFSVQNISGATYSWTSSSNLSISGSGNAVTVSGTGTNGAGWVEVYISTGCGTATRRMNVHKGPPGALTHTIETLFDPTQLCYLAGNTYTWVLSPHGPVPGATNIYFMVFEAATGPGSPIQGSYSQNMDVSFYWYPSNYTFMAWAENACGAGLITQKDVTTYATCDGPMFRMSVSPNPTSGQLVVEMDKDVSAGKVVFELFDFNTNERKRMWTQQSGQGRHNLSLHGLKKGLYILSVTKGKLKESKKVIIQ